MKLTEAYSILEIPSSSSADEAKKKYRELTKKYHPDINKESGAESKFKKINEAYQVILSGKSSDTAVSRSRGQSPFSRQTFVEITNIQVNTTISFMESVWGVKKDLKFTRKGKCAECNGQGEFTVNNGCAECGGRGQIVGRNGNMIFVSPCTKCNGETSVESCKPCSATGFLETEASVQVTIPGGVANNSVLRLAGMGNYAGSFMLNLDQYTDALLHISVIPEAGLTLDGQNVISTLELSLLEAIKGCSKKVKTIMGHKDIEIKPMSRNADAIVIPNMGVNRIGSQKVILDVKYPENINQLIEKGLS